MKKQDWQWFGNAGHLIVGQWCRFHLCTVVGKYIVSTVGEYWPERPTRETHAEIYDPKWLASNRRLRGDAFDHAYMNRFGFEEIGYKRKYETMVFPFGEYCSAKDCQCGMPMPSDWEEKDVNGYNSAKAARDGHLEMCQKWSRRK